MTRKTLGKSKSTSNLSDGKLFQQYFESGENSSAQSKQKESNSPNPWDLNKAERERESNSEPTSAAGNKTPSSGSFLKEQLRRLSTPSPSKLFFGKKDSSPVGKGIDARENLINIMASDFSARSNNDKQSDSRPKHTVVANENEDATRGSSSEIYSDTGDDSE